MTCARPSSLESGRSPGQWRLTCSPTSRGGPQAVPLDPDHRAGQRSRNAVYRLDLGRDQFAELVHVLGAGAHDDVIGAGDILRLHDSGDLRDLPGHVGGFADLCLDEDVCLHHCVLLGKAYVRRPELSRYSNGPDLFHPGRQFFWLIMVFCGARASARSNARSSARCRAASLAVTMITWDLYFVKDSLTTRFD